MGNFTADAKIDLVVVMRCLVSGDEGSWRIVASTGHPIK